MAERTSPVFRVISSHVGLIVWVDLHSAARRSRRRAGARPPLDAGRWPPVLPRRWWVFQLPITDIM